MGRTLVRIGATAQSCRADMENAIGVALRDAPGVVNARIPVALWRAPLEWLVLTEAGEETGIADRLRHALGDATGLVLDYSDAMSAIELPGDDATSILAAGTAVHVTSWPEQGAFCVPAAFAGIPVLIHRTGCGHFWLHVDRSLAHYLLHWLATGAIHET
jgi:heterotetrameric sarcosine oxidase gamma subunit